MNHKKVYRAIGLMSGTSLDGVDAALIETDGEYHVEASECFVTLPYTDEERKAIRTCFGCRDRHAPDVIEAEKIITRAHATAVKQLLDQCGYKSDDIDVIGFHGQTILHDVAAKLTIQIGDAKVLAQSCGIDVVYDLRQRDIQNGGQGAPLLPIYHQARLQGQEIEMPCAILNIGGVANVTYLPGHDLDLGTELIAFDTGPGNALMDDYMNAHRSVPYDKEGALAASGRVDGDVLRRWMSHDYFKTLPPKSLDRDEWEISDMGALAKDLSALGDEDTLATLLEFTARSIVAALDHLPKRPSHWYICGGGRHNTALIGRLRDLLGVPVSDAEHLNWNGDATEAEGFAYLAVRSLLGQPITFSGTTGVQAPLVGGTLIRR